MTEGLFCPKCKSKLERLFPTGKPDSSLLGFQYYCQNCRNAWDIESRT